MAKMTPMMEHYMAMKEQYPDCILFYRLGDFYEMFFDDAKEASQLLELTLTGRDCGLGERAPMCGVPYHAADIYIAKLVALGKKVAVCEQLTEPVPGKGMVERDVIRVISAGTLIEESLLDERRNNYIACVHGEGGAVGCAWADITTGEFSVREWKGEDALSACLDFLVKLAPAEIIAGPSFYEGTKNLAAARNLPKITAYASWTFVYRKAEETLLAQLGTRTLVPFGLDGKPCATECCGALLCYLRETQKHALKNMNTVTLQEDGNVLMLDSVAVRNLELVKTLSTGERKGSLLGVLDNTKTAMGARLLRRMLLNPLREKGSIEYRQRGTEELFYASGVRAGLADTLRGIGDIERITGKISNRNLTPRDCGNLGASLETVPSLRFQLSGFCSEILRDISEKCGDFTELAALLCAAFPENAPALTRDGGFIREGYSAELDKLRDAKENGAKKIADMETRERDRTGIRNLRIKYSRVFGYVIEVTNSFLDKVPEDYIRRQTLANCERFVTQELKETESYILSSEDKALALEKEIFAKICAVLEDNIPALKRLSEQIAILDCLVSFAQTAKTNNYTKPLILDAGEMLEIKDGRHPVVEVQSRERFVPNDTVLGGDSRTMVITGPNMAGKSTYMRQTALIVLLAHMGSFVPAKTARIPVTDRIFTRVGATDNLAQDQSTFMVEMTEVASILRGATENSLLILDEVGRGTSTYDGLSIAWAVLEHITEKIRAKTLFATHYHELTEMEGRIEGVRNFKVTVRETSSGIVFLRKIQRGGANKSFGIEVARLAGVPVPVVDRAKALLKKLEKNDIARSSVRDAAEERERETAAETETETKAREIYAALTDCDPDNMTPMQALRFLAALKKKAAEAEEKG